MPQAMTVTRRMPTVLRKRSDFTVSRSTSATFETSARMKTASPGPLAPTSAARAWPARSSRAQKTTFEPAPAKTRTHPSPMPFVPPVTTTTLSA